MHNKSEPYQLLADSKDFLIYRHSGYLLVDFGYLTDHALNILKYL